MVLGKKKHKVGIYSIPFCYGPTAKALLVAKYLEPYANIQFITYGSALELAKTSTKLPVIDCQGRDISNWTKSLLNEIDMLICFMDLSVSVQIIKKYPQIKVIIVDSLLWWRSDLEVFFENLEPNNCIYIAQNFPGTIQCAKNFSDRGWEIHIIEPIIEIKQNIISQDNLILVHYGGIESPILELNKDTNFHFLMTDILVKIFCMYYPDYTLLFTGNHKAMKQLSERYKYKNVKNIGNIEFSMLSNENFLNKLNQCNLILTVPSIETTYQAFYFNKPVIFLPPLNSTQNQQLSIFCDAGFWQPFEEEYYNKFLKHPNLSNLDYQRETKIIIERINKLLANTTSQYQVSEKLLARINNLMHNKFSYQEQIFKQNMFIEKFGTNGISNLVDIVIKNF